ncbi:MAG: ribbon-helix-helix domain-containing protein [Candidatus Pacebacteria bacterium]|jgi:Arc/MetJ-type ribon-helix-helix transcriptional regulator|nr:ribbon-helix-helix domain-containing protein [Candidatus Paceibacterota bacterium]NMB47739.1 ribbon-helix-helix protein, CopG family [Patescibacteria group bacterium]MDD2796847.1 ribbon-helix-helix domain-containing protein [Candidatus Paceibacterota bacterium]MDD3048163.1 ribbon-helix-helix domain-containing protein [Candidatus Paceibacterota bacterium]MDD3510250.1 ribbon-helix-helix domain-containing protein [Candidatus Paceibacterota bacterium]
MRKILNISLSKDLAEIVKKEVEQGGYSSVSEYIRFLIRKEKGEDLLKELIQSEKEIKAGNFKELKSLDDLK